MHRNKKVVIIGSGMGGLVCAAILAKEGYKVTVLEMNKQIGGNLQSFSREKHVFDTGVHYVGGLSEGQNLYKIFRYLGIMDKVDIRKLDENAFDTITFFDEEKEYHYAQGYENFAKTLIEDFPDEIEAIENYCTTIRDVCSEFPLYNLELGDYMFQSKYLGIDTKAYIDSITKNERLRKVLAGNNALYAGRSDMTPLYVHALVLNSYIESSYKFIKGGSQIAKHLSKVIRNYGGVIINKTEIKKFAVSNGLVEYVESTDNKIFEGDYFISNIHPAKTLELTDTDSIRPAYRNRVKNLENSISVFIVNIILKPDLFKHKKTNYYCYLCEDVWKSMEHTEETWPLSYALFYSETSLEKEFADGITVMAYMRIDEVAKWKDTRKTINHVEHRGEDYETFKKYKAEKLIDAVEKRFKGLRNAIKSYTCATPLTYRDYMGTYDGSIYGICKDYKDPLRTFISPKTRVDNLLLTGQNINVHGILGVSISALVTCAILIGMPELLAKIEDAQTK